MTTGVPVLTNALIAQWLGAFLWPFLRALGLILTAPAFGAGATPVAVKLSIAAALAFVLARVDPAAPGFWLSWHTLFLVAAQLVIGGAMGLAVRIVVSCFAFAGGIIGLQMGFGFATLLDFQSGAPMPVMADFYDLLSVVLFLALNGHLILIAALARSMSIVPVGSWPGIGSWHVLATAGTAVFEYGVMISLPAIAAIMAVNLGLGVLTRIAPQVNVISVGFSIFIGLGLATAIITMPFLVTAMAHVIRFSSAMMMGAGFR